MEYDREFTERLYVSTGLKYDVEDGVDTDATWDEFKHQDKANFRCSEKNFGMNPAFKIL
jgi:hypothetical protein